MTGTIGFTAIRERLFAAIASAVGLDPSVFERPGTTVVASEERRGRGTVVVHGIGRHSLVWCDPLVAHRVEGLASADTAFPVDRVEAWAPGAGASFVGGARSLLADRAMLIDLPEPGDGCARRLVATDGADRALISGLLAATDPDDADAAEIELETLDPHIVGLLDDHGSLAAIASARPWEYASEFGNIGVLVRADRRRGGWGRSVVSILAGEILAESRFPLYRCNWDREPSHRLAMSLGFSQATNLAAVRFEGGD